MKQNDHYENRILRLFMTGTGIVLVVLLLGKAVGAMEWAGTRKLAASAIQRQLTEGLSYLWKQSYPAAGDAFEKDQAGHENEGENWCLNAVFKSFPLYRFLNEEAEARPVYREQDPSYKTYKQNREFYQEHEYLFRYGDEESNQGEEGGLVVAEVLETSAVEPPQPQETAPVPEETEGVGATPAYTVLQNRPTPGKQYVKEQLADYDFLMKHFYNVHASTTADRKLMNAEEFLNRDFKLTGADDKPQILIYHTHSQETFADFGPENPGGTVVGMGAYLTELLTQKGYQVIHDTSVYDLHGEKLDRNKAYTYALEGITGILQQNPSIEVVLDLHRDGVKESLHLVNDVNGKPTASIMFFNGVSQTPDGPIEYLPNPYREDNLAFSLQLQLDAAAYYPGLTRKIYLKGLRYNLHLRPRSALVEVGAQTNTYQEALNAMEPLSELLDMVLQGN